MKKMLLLLIACSSLSLMGRPGDGPGASNQIIPLGTQTPPLAHSLANTTESAQQRCLQNCGNNPAAAVARFIADFACLPVACVTRTCKNNSDGFFYWTRRDTSNDKSMSSEDCTQAHGLDCCSACEGCCTGCCDLDNGTCCDCCACNSCCTCH